MKVLFVTRGFPSAQNVMSGNYEAVQAKAIAAKGHHVSLISVYEKTFWKNLFTWKTITYKKVDKINVYEGIYPTISIRFVRRINKYLRKISYKHVFQRVVKEQGMPDVIHAHLIFIASATIFFKDKYHLPFVITEHWTKTNVSEIPKWVRNMSFAYHKADQVICVSQTLAVSLKRNFQVESIVINNMVSDQFFNSSKIKRTDNIFMFIAIGAFRKNKGFDILIDAFAQANFPSNILLNIIGDGEERELIENKIKSHGLSEQVKLLGTKTPEEVSDQLCNADCFVLSSRLETFAIVVIEAMAKGVPVIATRSGGPETFLRPEHGLLVEKENIGELANAMKYMVEHYKDYDSKQIRQFCYDNFSQDVIADKIINIYKKVLANKNRDE